MTISLNILKNRGTPLSAVAGATSLRLFCHWNTGEIHSSPGLSASTIVSLLFLTFLRVFVRYEKCQANREIEN